MALTEAQLQAICDDALRELITKDYLLFCRWVFKSIRNLRFVQAEHHEQIAEFLVTLEETGGGGVINMPPRFGKTEMAVVLWMTWTFARNPRAQFVHVSTSEDLALKNSGAVKEIVQHPEFRRMFPGCRVKPESAAKKLWETTAGGGVRAASAMSVVTGFGAGRMDYQDGDPFDGAIIIDDPIKPMDAKSEVMRITVNENLSATIRSRRNHPMVPILIIMQRVHEDDPTNFAMTGKLAMDFDQLCLKARKDDGTALWPEKLSLEEMARMEIEDKMTFASQYQQSPVVLGGNLFKYDWFRRYERVAPGIRYHSWDTASKKKKHSDPSCLTVWELANGVFQLVEVFVEKLEYPELKRKIKYYANRDKPAAVLIEDKSSGQALIQDLNAEAFPIPIIAIEPEGDKLARAITVTGYYESGKVLMPKGAPWLIGYESELTTFPNAKHDDQVDSSSQFLNYMRLNGAQSYAEMMAALGYPT